MPVAEIASTGPESARKMELHLGAESSRTQLGLEEQA